MLWSGFKVSSSSFFNDYSDYFLNNRDSPANYYYYFSHRLAIASDRHEARRHASVLILREMAQNAPTLFYPYVSQFFENIWAALRDAKVVIREGAADALRACLELISQRESQQRPQWYQNIYDEANKSKLLFSLLFFLYLRQES